MIFLNDDKSNDPIRGYFEALDEAAQDCFLPIHDFIIAKFPELTVKLAYGLPTYRHGKRNIIHIGVHRDHIGVYPGSFAIEALGDELTEYSLSKGTIRVPLGIAFPYDLLQRLIRFNLVGTDYKSHMRDAYLREQAIITNVYPKPWGYLFCNLDNPIFHQANHALITDERKLDKTLDEIVSFYTNQGLEPFIYAFHDDGQLARIKDKLIAHGFVIDNDDEIEMMLTRPIVADKQYRQTFQRVTAIDDAFVERNMSQEEREYFPKAMKLLIKDPNRHFIYGFIDDVAVTSAIIVDYGFGYSVLENVETRADMRNKGYASELISFIVGYFKSNMKGNLILAVENEQAKHIYEKHGFQAWHGGSKFWTARVKKTP